MIPYIIGNGFSIQSTIIPSHHKLTSVSPSNKNPQLIQPQIVQQVSLGSSVVSSNENKIYHCTHCQQLFLKLKAFKKHQCLSVSNSREKKNADHQLSDQIDESPTKKSRFSPRQNEITQSTPIIITSNKTSIDTKQVKNKIVNMNSSDLLLNENHTLLKHPLVVKTLLETYKVSSLSELNLTHDTNNKSAQHNEQTQSSLFNLTKNFFMCSACGYRGNTVRGVKQHGKSHLQEREHFGIISATERHPLLVYYSLNDMELQSLSVANKRCSVFLQEFSIKDSVSNGEIRETMQDSFKDKKYEENSSGGGEIASKSSNELSDDYQEAKFQHQPITKKARLLDAHQKAQDSLASNLKCVDDLPGSIIKLDNSQTYCFKCNIQFQQVSNYLAHKTNYCNDN